MNFENISLPEVNQTALDIRPVSGWFNDWLKGIEPQENRISLLLPRLDSEMKGKLRGKLGVVIHYGGTKKSLYAQNVAYHNIKENRQRVIYSSMEMGITEAMSRFIDLCLVFEEIDYNASWHLELTYRENKEVIKPAFDQFVAPIYSDKLYLCQNSGLTCDEYIQLIDKLKSEGKETDILIVDGLSMMGGKGTELELANIHTRRLKELAKDYNIFVLCIVHASRGVEKHTRDVSKHARGSEKIIDNCDFYICPSLVQDHSIVEEYRKDIGYIRLVNKRGSGNTVNVIYGFDRKRLAMFETTYRPEDFDKANNGSII